MVSVGDIVVIGNRPETWAVLQLERAVPRGSPPDVLLGAYRRDRFGERVPTHFRVSVDAVSVVTSQIFQVGQLVKVHDGPGTVLSDDGTTVTVSVQRTIRFADGETAEHIGKVDVDRGSLVRDNFL